MNPVDYSRHLAADPVRKALNPPDFFTKQARRLEREQAEYKKNALSRVLHRRRLQAINAKLAFARSQASAKPPEPEGDGPEL